MAYKHRYAFSPSLHHRCLMDHTRQALAYDGGDVKTWQGRLRRKLRQLIGAMPGKLGLGFEDVHEALGWIESRDGQVPGSELGE